ncbi:hypothetical protein [Cohnella caldifontis]|uniref:hypothetical protein n=1 Tax=Cohnella caldifontis TaxID=3027471 RepID=UPI0023ECB33B|nr:hypothetical protein [Cohnella sp. YIM B05605]
MKKKVMMLGVGLTIGSALVATSAFAGIGEAKGYEAYKTALKTTAAVASSTDRVTLSMRDNGTELLNVSTTVKSDQTAGTASGQAEIKAGSVSQTFEFYQQDGKHVFKAGGSDTYEVMEDRSREEWKEHEQALRDPAFSAEMEKVVDALVGNLKNQFDIQSEADGTSTIDAKLTGSEIPAAVNVIGSLFVKEGLSGKHADRWDRHSPAKDALGLDIPQIAERFPKLTQDVNLDEIELHAVIDENDIVSSQEIDFTVSGKDASGKSHEVVIRAAVETTGLGATTPDTIDLTGKKIETVKDMRD